MSKLKGCPGLGVSGGGWMGGWGGEWEVLDLNHTCIK